VNQRRPGYRHATPRQIFPQVSNKLLSGCDYSYRAVQRINVQHPCTDTAITRHRPGFDHATHRDCVPRFLLVHIRPFRLGNLVDVTPENLCTCCLGPPLFIIDVHLQPLSNACGCGRHLYSFTRCAFIFSIPCRHNHHITCEWIVVRTRCEKAG
jgi:hypothetical protein